MFVRHVSAGSCHSANPSECECTCFMHARRSFYFHYKRWHYKNVDQREHRQKKMVGKNELEDCVRMLINKIHYFSEIFVIFVSFLFIIFFYFTILYWFCHTLTWVRHGCTRVPHPEPPSYLPPHAIPLGHPSAPAPSILYHASNLDWRFVSHMIICCFNAILPNHPTLALSHRVQKTVLYICVSFAVSHTGLSLPSF